MSVRLELEGETWGHIENDLADLGFVRQTKPLPLAAATHEVRPAQGIEPSPNAEPAPTAPEPAKRGRKPKERPAPEKPVEAVQQQATEAAQDAADEAAEKGDDTPLTVDDLRQAMTTYVSKFGMEAAAADRGKVFEWKLGKPPVGDIWSIKMFMQGEADYNEAAASRLREAVAAWKAAAEENPFERKPV